MHPWCRKRLGVLPAVRNSDLKSELRRRLFYASAIDHSLGTSLDLGVQEPASSSPMRLSRCRFVTWALGLRECWSIHDALTDFYERKKVWEKFLVPSLSSENMKDLRFTMERVLERVWLLLCRIRGGVNWLVTWSPSSAGICVADRCVWARGKRGWGLSREGNGCHGGGHLGLMRVGKGIYRHERVVRVAMVPDWSMFDRCFEPWPKMKMRNRDPQMLSR